MEYSNPLATILLFLTAAVIAVPLFRKIKLGEILGYLVAGVALGPSGFAFISDAESVLHFAEIGVVLLLFIIGLELDPDKLWSMRKLIAGLGIGQLLLSALFIAALVWSLLGKLDVAIIVGLSLGLSSTAFAIQLMAERGVMARQEGRRGFAILLLQDLAVIPILFLVSALATKSTGHSVAWYWSVSAVIVLLATGRYLLIPVLSLVTRYGSRETMTAASLLIVVGAAYLMYVAGLSMGMGALIAGILLANSSFKHQLESDVEPFKGITLGLFFIAIGMTLDLQLLLQQPIFILLCSLALMVLKTVIISGLLKWVGIPWRQGLNIGLMLSQGGEFAFVVMAQASSGGVVPIDLANQVNLIVGLSMALTAPLVGALEWFFKKTGPKQTPSEIDNIPSGQPEVLILGFGRFGQTTGRILAASNIPFIALDKNAEHIDFVRRFGNKVYFGDATRLDVLQQAGIGSVKVVLVATDDMLQTETIVKLIKPQYPKVKIIVRARNRSAYWSLRAAGAESVVREIFKGSLEAANSVLTAVGFNYIEALRKVDSFEDHDNHLLNDTFEHRGDLDSLITIGRRGRADLERLFNEDQ
ncbi:MAG: CPA2 family monovalent cation:H+ antiporter-2 [Cellvibrionaceae bacterium]|jgi:CPA2 family monovalent cation:H+ antiporter-2